ncbi:MAG: MaoC family dehydratase N-terminal domain-containing protein [Burkholderiales bacterium]
MLAIDTIAVGAELPTQNKGPWTSSRIARWCAAQENWDRIHYDLDYARNVAKLPHTVINGALKQHLLVQFLDQAFAGAGWIWRLDYRFVGMDLVGQSLAVGGVVRRIEKTGERTFVHVDLNIRNLDAARVTTSGTAVVLFTTGGTPPLDALDLLREGEALTHPEAVADANIPEAVRRSVGSEIDSVTAYSPVGLSRLRLFAEAVMNLRPLHYDAQAGAQSPYGTVVAPPLFPIHALSHAPGRRELSTDPEAFGREGASEVGRNIAQIFGLPAQGLLNGSNKAQIHSLLRVGETVRARSVLAAARYREGARGGAMMIFETANEYETTDGRPLLTEHQSIIQRQLA